MNIFVANLYSHVTNINSRYPSARLKLSHVTIKVVLLFVVFYFSTGAQCTKILNMKIVITNYYGNF